MANECLFEANERTAFPVAVSFLDEDGVAATPTTATARIDDEQNRRQIRPPTGISPLSSTVDVWITSDENFIIRSRNKYEIRTLTIEYDYDSDDGPKHATAYYRYKLINLYGVVDVPSASVSPSASASPSV